MLPFPGNLSRIYRLCLRCFKKHSKKIENILEILDSQKQQCNLESGVAVCPVISAPRLPLWQGIVLERSNEVSVSEQEGSLPNVFYVYVLQTLKAQGP